MKTPNTQTKAQASNESTSKQTQRARMFSFVIERKLGNANIKVITNNDNDSFSMRRSACDILSAERRR